MSSDGDDMINLPSPRYILVHSHDSTVDANNLDRRGHAFGPFDSFEAVVAFDQKMPRDTCYRFAVPLLGPKNRDVMTTMMGLRVGARPGAVSLPPRDEPSDSTPISRLIAEAINELFPPKPSE